MTSYLRLIVILMNVRWQAGARQALEPHMQHVLGAFEVDYTATTHHLQALAGAEVAHFNDAAHRGNKWYDDIEHDHKSDSTFEEKESSSLESSYSGDLDNTGDGTSDASSMETAEKDLRSRAYRECTPCPEDMLKKYTNLGILWICGMYQRARRTFKSECMMRFRNCQDGTMFVKLYDHKCKDDSRHGKHWFYVYQV